MDIIGSMSTEELSSAHDAIDQFQELLDVAKYIISDPDSTSKEVVVETLETLVTIMGMMLAASEMIVDVELISRPPNTN